MASSLFLVLGSAQAAGGGGGSTGAEGAGLGTPNGAGATGATLPSNVTPSKVSPGPTAKRLKHRSGKATHAAKKMDKATSTTQ